LPGEFVDDDAYVSRITVRSRPRKSMTRMSNTTTTAAMIPHVPPGKVRVVVVTSVAVVVIDPSVVVGVVAVPVVVGSVPCVVGVVCCWSTVPAPAAAGGVAVWVF
jgi:hypothetical protein